MEAIRPKFSEFNVRGLNALNKMIQKDPTILNGEWKLLAYKLFGMTDKQKEFIKSCPEELDSKLRDFFKSSAKKAEPGTTTKFKVIKEDDDVKTLYLMQIPNKEKSAKGTPVMKMSSDLKMTFKIPIIKCDAYCGDWHWAWA